MNNLTGGNYRVVLPTLAKTALAELTKPKEG